MGVAGWNSYPAANGNGVLDSGESNLVTDAAGG
jgi:hypothetical protein